MLFIKNPIKISFILITGGSTHLVDISCVANDVSPVCFELMVGMCIIFFPHFLAAFIYGDICVVEVC